VVEYRRRTRLRRRRKWPPWNAAAALRSAAAADRAALVGDLAIEMVHDAGNVASGNGSSLTDTIRCGSAVCCATIEAISVQS